MENIDKDLEQRDKAELIAIIKQMLRQQPELEWLLKTALPTASTSKRRVPIDPELYRRQIADILSVDDWRGRDDVDIESGLSAIKAIADGFAEQENYFGALAIYEVLVTEILKYFNSYPDEYIAFSIILNGCIDGLDTCFAGEEDNQEMRERVIRTLFAIYRFHVDSGMDLDIDVQGLLVGNTTPEERRVIAGWVRDVLSQVKETRWSNGYNRQRYGAFLLDLEEETLDDETFLRICRETNRFYDAVDRLLTLGRIDEALNDAQKVSDYELIGMADLFIRHGHDAIAERLVQERSRSTPNWDTRLLEWLKTRYLAREDYAAALEMAEAIFRTRPSLEGYKDIRQLAARFDRWEAVRSELLAFLEQSRDKYLLVYVALDEGDIDKALELVKPKEKPREPYVSGYSIYGYGSPSIALEVAQAAEATRPRAALEIYQQHVERLINGRGRENYIAACRYLSRMRALYERLNENETWTSYITNLREKNRNLRALKEELANAGL